MHLRFLLLLAFAACIFACNDAPATSENQTEENLPVTVAVENSAADTPGGETLTAQVAENQPVENTAPVERPASVQPPKPTTQPVSVKNEIPAPSNATVPATTVSEEPPAAAPIAKTTAKNQEISADAVVPVPAEKPAAPLPPSHEDWDKLLKQYVSATGKVDYAGFKKDKTKLEAYVAVLQKNHPQNDWPRAEKMAFWINAYNAFTVKLIVDNYPISSIMKLDGGKTWDVKRINIGGKNYSLNNIENDILRPQFKDPRIHFAVNCAAKSCPPLLNRAWTAANLESNFEKQAKAFINNPDFNKISAKEVEVSKVFEWYAEDFGNLVEYLNKYSTTKINANAKVKYRDYDWALNE